MNSSIIPPVSSTEAKKSYEDNIEAWKNYAQRITKNPFVKSFLLKRDDYKCPCCERSLSNNSQVHHSSYNHICTFNVVIRVDSPTPHNPHKTRLVPDCQSCRKQDEYRFAACMSKLAQVHPLCNKKVYDYSAVSGT